MTTLREAAQQALEEAARAVESFSRVGYDMTGDLELHEYIRAMKEQT